MGDSLSLLLALEVFKFYEFETNNHVRQDITW